MTEQGSAAGTSASTAPTAATPEGTTAPEETTSALRQQNTAEPGQNTAEPGGGGAAEQENRAGWGPRTPDYVPPGWEGPDPRTASVYVPPRRDGGGHDGGGREMDDPYRRAGKRPRDGGYDERDGRGGGYRGGHRDGYRRSRSRSRSPPRSRPRPGGSMADKLADLARSQAAAKARNGGGAADERAQEPAAVQHRPLDRFVAKYAVDPHVKGHAKEYKLPTTKVEQPVEVAAVRCDRKSGAYTYHKTCQLVPADAPQSGADLEISRSGSELCGRCAHIKCR